MSEQGVGKKEEREEVPGAGASSLERCSGISLQPWHELGGLPTAAPSGFLEEKLLWKRRWMLLCQPGAAGEAQGCSESTQGLLQE